MALFWLVITVAGVLTVSGTTHRMTNSFAMPGQAFKVDNQIAAEYGNGGSQTPYVPVVTVPAGQRATSSAGPGHGRPLRQGQLVAPRMAQRSVTRGPEPRGPSATDGPLVELRNDTVPKST